MDRVRGGARPAPQPTRLSPKKRLVAALVSLAAVVMLVPLTSMASHVDLRDANDTRGPLDIRLVTMGSGDAPRWTVTTWGSWRAVDVWDAGFIVIKLDTFGDSHHDYYALVRSAGARMVGTLHRDHVRRDDRRIRSLQVSRPNRSSVRFALPYRAMRFSEPRTFRWVADTMWTSRRCGEATCLDRAPDEGAVEEPRRPVPTPTLTQTPTPVPTETDR